MAQSKTFVDASHSLNELSHALALLESENSSLRGAVNGFTSENAKLRELARLLLWGVDNDMPRYEELAWTQKVNALVRELGVEL